MTEEKDPSYRQTVPGSNANEQGKKVLKIVLIALVVLIVLGAIGTLALGVFFSKGIDRALEHSSENITESNEDSSFAAEVRLPDDFPNDVPLFEDGEVIASRTQQTEEGTNYLATFKTGAEPEKVGDFYERELTAHDWNITSTSMTGGNVSYVAEKEDLRISVNVVSLGEENGTHYTITADRER